MTPPHVVDEISNSLQPFLKPRSEIAHIRRILQEYLNSKVNPGTGVLRRGQLSHVDSSWKIQETEKTGLLRDYIDISRMNVAAQQAFEETKLKDPCALKLRELRPTGNHSSHHDNDHSYVDQSTYINLLEAKRHHNRLLILQDYVDSITQKAHSLRLTRAAHAEDMLPKIPPEVLHVHVSSKTSSTDLGELMIRLERSSLRAKLLLKQEQRFLSKIQADNDSTVDADAGDIHLQALAKTRNELIQWIESELSDTNEEHDLDTDKEQSCSVIATGDNLKQRLHAVREQYMQYVTTRLSLRSSHDTSEPSVQSVTKSVADNAESSKDRSRVQGTNYEPYLAAFLRISEEQKSMNQQKAHLIAVSLKQAKDLGQDLDRLAQESHLIPALNKSTTSHKKRQSGSVVFGKDWSSANIPVTTTKAQDWARGAEHAGNELRSAVMESLETGEEALASARSRLLQLQDMVGKSPHPESAPKDDTSNIWKTMDGTLTTIGT